MALQYFAPKFQCPHFISIAKFPDLDVCTFVLAFTAYFVGMEVTSDRCTAASLLRFTLFTFHLHCLIATTYHRSIPCWSYKILHFSKARPNKVLLPCRLDTPSTAAGNQQIIIDRIIPLHIFCFSWSQPCLSQQKLSASNALNTCFIKICYFS